jgi:hypothetical protein
VPPNKITKYRHLGLTVKTGDKQTPIRLHRSNY